MISHFSDQFDPLAGRETTSEIVSGLPWRIAKARIQAAATLANQVLDRARTNPLDRSIRPRRRSLTIVAHHDGETFTYGVELAIISVCLGTIVAAMLVNVLH
jgi:hypothetical protein